MGGKEREGEGGLYLRVVGTRTHNAKRAEGCDNETFGSTLDQPLSISPQRQTQKENSTSTRAPTDMGNVV